MISPVIKVNIIGIFLAISFILSIISTFTTYWIVYNVRFYGIVDHVGIVPYHSGRFGWFEAASVLFFASLALFVPLLVVYGWTWHQVRHHGCCYDNRTFFRIISMLCTIITCLQIVTFVLFAVNSFHYVRGQNEQLGSSAYMAISSAVLLFVPVGLSSHISRYDCCE